MNVLEYSLIAINKNETDLSWNHICKCSTYDLEVINQQSQLFLDYDFCYCVQNGTMYKDYKQVSWYNRRKDATTEEALEIIANRVEEIFELNHGYLSEDLLEELSEYANRMKVPFNATLQCKIFSNLRYSDFWDSSTASCY